MEVQWEGQHESHTYPEDPHLPRGVYEVLEVHATPVPPSARPLSNTLILRLLQVHSRTYVNFRYELQGLVVVFIAAFARRLIPARVFKIASRPLFLQTWVVVGEDVEFG